MTGAIRVGILGGTFDPIHVGHLAAARAAQAALALTRVCFVPAHHPPHRPGPQGASGALRLEMVQLAIAGTPDWEASDLELRRDGPSYTYDTLAALHARGLRPTQIFFIIGADAFADIRAWRHYPALLDAAHFVVVARPGSAALQELPVRLPELAPRMAAPNQAVTAARPCIVPLAADTPDVSATQVRDLARRGADLSGLVPPAVAAFIAGHGLYRQARTSSSTATTSGR